MVLKGPEILHQTLLTNFLIRASRYNSLKVATLSICLSNIQIDSGLVIIIDVQFKMRRLLILQRWMSARFDDSFPFYVLVPFMYWNNMTLCNFPVAW